MQKFVYRAKSKEGKTQEGRVEARDMTVAVAILRERGLTVVSVHPLNEGMSLDNMLATFQKVKFGDIVTFTRQLATMIAAGLPLTEALSILEIQSKPALGKVIGDIMRDVQGGATLADAMEKHPDVFSDVYVALVRAGEAAGAIDKILKRLATNLEKENEFRAKTKGALIYPVIVMVGMTMVMAIMMIFVVPKLAEMYKDFDAELPLPTLILIGTSNFFVAYWPLMLLVAGGMVFAFKSYAKTPDGRIKLDKLKLSLPIFGKLRSNVLLTDLTRTLSLLIGAGISFVEGLEIVNKVIDNKIYSMALEESMRNVKKGIPFSVTLARQGIFPPILPNMVAVGEETGKMDVVLSKVAKYFEQEAEHLIKNLTTALEPLIMIILGLGVGFLVISIIMPIYNLTNKF